MNSTINIKYSVLLTLIIFIIRVGHCNSQETTKNELDSIYALQAVHYKAKEYTKVIKLSEYAKNIALNSAQDSLTFARIIAYIGYAQNKYENFYQSITGFEDALNYIPSTKDKGTINTNYNILYDLLTRYYSLRRYKKALSVALQIESLINQYDFISQSKHIWLYQRKFRIYSALGFYKKAGLEVDKIKQRLGPDPNESDENMRYSWMRYYRTSLLLNYNEALFLKEQNNGDLDGISYLRDNVLANMAKLDSIVDHTTSLQNPKTRNQIWNLSLYVGALYYVSDFYKELEDYDQALHYINKAISLSEKSNEPIRNISEFFRFKANVINISGDTSKALILLNQLERDYHENSFNFQEVLVSKGDIYTAEKKLDSVLHYYKKAVTIMHNSDAPLNSDFKNYVSRNQFPNDCKQMQHMSDMLFTYFPESKMAMQTAKNLNTIAFKEFLDNHNNLDLSLGNRQLFYNIIECMLELDTAYLKNKNSFISHLENISNRLAWQQFTESRDIVLLPVTDSLELVEFQIRKQLVQAKKQRQQKLKDSLEIVLSTHQNRTQKQYPAISNFTQDNFELSNFQNKLKDGEVALKYMFFKEQFVVFQITKTNVLWQLKPWKEKEQQQLTKHLNSLKSLETANELDHELTALLIPEGVLSSFNTIRIIPDKPIYYLPFETLSYKNDYLVKEKAILYSSHLRFSFFEGLPTTHESEVTIFAPNYNENETAQQNEQESVNLKGAQEEAKILETLFSSKAFLGKKATKENFVTYKSQGNILHMAMHASVDKDEPIFSHFNFFNNEKLFLEELYALKIPADLAVLSACNTAVGKEDGNLTIGSLHRAFSYAGTTATLASLWEVPDQTSSKIMISFYKYLKQGASKSVALQNAKVDYLNNTKNPKLREPYYWGGFVLYGEDKAIHSPTSNVIWYLLLSLVIIVTGGLILKRKRSSKAA